MKNTKTERTFFDKFLYEVFTDQRMQDLIDIGLKEDNTKKIKEYSLFLKELYKKIHDIELSDPTLD